MASSSNLGAVIAAIVAHVLTLYATSAGYIIIGKRAFFGLETYRLSLDVIRFFGIALVALRVAGAIGQLNLWTAPVIMAAAVRTMAFVVVLVGVVLATRSVREVLTTSALFDFTRHV